MNSKLWELAVVSGVVGIFLVVILVWVWLDWRKEERKKRELAKSLAASLIRDAERAGLDDSEILAALVAEVERKVRRERLAAAGWRFGDE